MVQTAELSESAVADAVEHCPGVPKGRTRIAEVLWRQFLKHDPADPSWPDRDRFVLSNGHGSMLLDGLLRLTGYTSPVKPGVEITPGPQGQALANAVGMALAERLLAAEFNRPAHVIVDHRTWVFIDDECLMEGISHEACSLAGTLGLSKLIVIYDDNGSSIERHVAHGSTDDTPGRFEAYGWRVVRAIDGHDREAIEGAIGRACEDDGRPTLMCCKTTPGQGSAAWEACPAGAARQAGWCRRFAAYADMHPYLAAEFARRVMRRALPDNWPRARADALAKAVASRAGIASRKASQNALQALQPCLPELLGGSADLSCSNLTQINGSVPVRDDRWGNYINYGVREFGMSAVMNGVALHGGLVPYGGTFLTFSDYSRNAVRMAAMMHQRVIYVFTHDSIGLGEDGPTHQPIEQVSALRLIPNNSVWRPCDAVETVTAWIAGIERGDGPTCLILSRQNLPHFDRQPQQLANIRRGGYVLADSHDPAVTLLATGSEVALAMQARDALRMQGIAARVVSMPSCSDFDRQSPDYRAGVLPRHVPVLAIEAGVTQFWRAYTGFNGDVIGIDRFGESAPAADVAEELGLTLQAVVTSARRLAGRSRRS